MSGGDFIVVGKPPSGDEFPRCEIESTVEIDSRVAYDTRLAAFLTIFGKENRRAFRLKKPF